MSTATWLVGLPVAVTVTDLGEHGLVVTLEPDPSEAATAVAEEVSSGMAEQPVTGRQLAAIEAFAAAAYGKAEYRLHVSPGTVAEVQAAIAEKGYWTPRQEDTS